MFLENPKDSVWGDWGTLGKIRGITHPPLKNPISFLRETVGSCGLSLKGSGVFFGEMQKHQGTKNLEMGFGNAKPCCTDFS